MKQLIKQIFKFCIVGGIAFVVDYSILYICTEYLNIYVLYSSIISFSISVIVNYILSSKYVFKIDNDISITKQFIIFLIISALGLGITQLIMWIGIDILKLYYMLVKIFATLIVMCFNFIFKKIFLEKKVKTN